MTPKNRIEISFQEPRLITVVIHGDYDIEQATETFDKIEALIADEPFFLLEVVMNHIGKTSPEARRIAAERLKLLPRRAIAITGGSFAQRIAANLVLRAAMMLDKHNTTASSTSFKKGEDAREWLLSMQDKWQS